jgi:predicted RNase H-like HicB family nuclease
MATRSDIRATVTIPRTYRVRFAREAVGGYSASVPELPGCYSEGDTLAEARRNIRDAIRGFLVALEKAQRRRARLARAARAEG